VTILASICFYYYTYKIYRRDNNNFIVKLSDITLDPSDEEVGVFEYGTYDDVTGEYTPD